jgi:hypothetical protein
MNQLYLKCANCQQYFEYLGEKTNKYCSNACKQKAYRAAHSN